MFLICNYVNDTVESFIIIRYVCEISYEVVLLIQPNFNYRSRYLYYTFYHLF